MGLGGEDRGVVLSSEIKETTVDMGNLEEMVVQPNASDRNINTTTTAMEEQVVAVLLDHRAVVLPDQMTTSSTDEQDRQVIVPDDESSSMEGIQNLGPVDLGPYHHALVPVLDPGQIDHVFNVYCGSKYLSERGVNHRLYDDHGGSGFYKVPADIRRRAGTEAGHLYDPKYVNFRKINNLLLQAESSSLHISLRRQLSHYCYHLNSYVEGEKEKLKSLMLWLDQYKKLEGRKERDDVGATEHQYSWVDDHMISSLGDLGLLFATSFLGDLFGRSSRKAFSALEDPECAQLWVSELWSDLILLENQVPLFRLTDPMDPYALMDLHRNTGTYFRDYIPVNEQTYVHLRDHTFPHGLTPRNDRYRHASRRYLHVLHFVHELLLPNHWGDEGHLYRFFRTWPWSYLCWPIKLCSHLLSSCGNSWDKVPSRMEPIPTATRLHLTGVRFVPAIEEGFKVEFKGGVLNLPRLHVSPSTKKMLANLIAWEMCHREAPKYFINYAIFMDHLINTAKDVEILIQSRVFEHSLATDDEVAAIFNGLGRDLVYAKSLENAWYDIFPKLTVDINKYYQSRPNKWLANLMQEYFKSPWTIISFIAAIFLILLTTVQTFFAVFAYVRPPPQ
ncbi:hypothetical protein H6P81_016952 [Aristolochia fimbriata]|uniref:Uncharacterized protein n=1 Tax=Aristolochia fimbriata TaxID=158543 RepID=A0AAV7DX09_ARIFI|nr:hypothetical protein H6P81_016952 [Aristolochia fimbriata]